MIAISIDGLHTGGQCQPMRRVGTCMSRPSILSTTPPPKSWCHAAAPEPLSWNLYERPTSAVNGSTHAFRPLRQVNAVGTLFQTRRRPGHPDGDPAAIYRGACPHSALTRGSEAASEPCSLHLMSAREHARHRRKPFASETAAAAAVGGHVRRCSLESTRGQTRLSPGAAASAQRLGGARFCT